MTTNVELYEALKPTVGEEAARMIAEVVPPTRDLATKQDIGILREEFAAFRGEMREEFAAFRGEMRGEMRAENTRTIKWIVGVLVPMWAATWATMAALFLRVA